ncbi:MAG: hypothetical protein ACPIOQ_70470, partial [Promethearchaeia archaeon]
RKVMRECLLKDADANAGNHLLRHGPVDVALDSGNAWAVRALLSKVISSDALELRRGHSYPCRLQQTYSLLV